MPFLGHFRIRHAYVFFVKKLWFDNIYNRIFVKSILKVSYEGTYKVLDKGLFDYIGSQGLFLIVQKIQKHINTLQSGYLYNYVLLSFVGLAAFSFVVFLLIKIKWR
jgi:NADH:ubiquinone oxidoreductase subunit 5 (subunit L)/multisubunit Na+/H+ antiporter MnhA subunit